MKTIFKVVLTLFLAGGLTAGAQAGNHLPGNRNHLHHPFHGHHGHHGHHHFHGHHHLMNPGNGGNGPHSKAPASDHTNH